MRYALSLFPKISVVTPSFNQGRYIGETLESIRAQRYPNLEVIVMDGGSTDETAQVVKSFGDLVDTFVSEPDRGQAHAINKGLARATGEVLCWLNSDDVFLPGALNAVAYAFSSRPAWDWISGPSLKFGDAIHEVGGKYILPLSCLEWLLCCPISQPSTFWRRRLYDTHGGIDESYHFALDYEYWVRFAFGGERVHFLNRPLSGFRLHGESKTVALHEKFAAEEVQIRDTYSKSLSVGERATLDRRLKAFQGSLALSNAVDFLDADQLSRARSEVMRIIQKNPSLLFTRAGAASLVRVAFNRSKNP